MASKQSPVASGEESPVALSGYDTARERAVDEAVTQTLRGARKRPCVRPGREVLTPTACAYLYDRSPTTVRAARRANPSEAVVVTLCFGSAPEREVHLLRPAWAETVWPRPRDFPERLALLREQGQPMSFDGVASYLVLSPTPVHMQAAVSTVRMAERDDAEHRERARREILKSRGKFPGASASMEAARLEDSEIESRRDAEREGRAPAPQSSSRRSASIGP